MVELDERNAKIAFAKEYFKTDFYSEPKDTLPNEQPQSSSIQGFKSSIVLRILFACFVFFGFFFWQEKQPQPAKEVIKQSFSILKENTSIEEAIQNISLKHLQQTVEKLSDFK